MAKIIPYLYSEDARKQAEFIVEALGGEIICVQTFSEMPNAAEDMKDKVMHLAFQAAGQTFYMCDSVQEPVTQGNQVNLLLEYSSEEDARQAFNNLANNGTIVMPLERMFWGAMFGYVIDKFGIRWQIATEA